DAGDRPAERTDAAARHPPGLGGGPEPVLPLHLPGRPPAPLPPGRTLAVSTLPELRCDAGNRRPGDALDRPGLPLGPGGGEVGEPARENRPWRLPGVPTGGRSGGALAGRPGRPRSEEHTSELQSRENLVCRLLLEK